MSDYLCVYIVIIDYLCVYIVMHDYLCVYIVMHDYMFFTVCLKHVKDCNYICVCVVIFYS